LRSIVMKLLPLSLPKNTRRSTRRWTIDQ
jgi:hypothetical protein